MLRKCFVLIFSVLFISLPLANVVRAQTAPTLSVAPPVVAPGGTIRLSGSRYAAGSTYLVSANTAPPATSSVIADSSGNISTSLTVPGTAPIGTYTVSLSAGATTVTRAPFAVGNPHLTLTPDHVSANGNVHVTGGVFPQNSQVTVSVTFTTIGNGATQTVTLPVTTDDNGSFATDLHVPIATAPKVYTVHASLSGSQSDLATAPLTVVAGIVLNPAVLMTGTSGFVSVSGTGFGANEQVQISYTANLMGGGTTTEHASATTGSDGSFTNAQLPAPANMAPGFTSVTAHGQTSNASASAQLEVVQFTLTPPAVGPGGTTAATGSGFTPNSSLAVYATVNLTSGGSQQIVVPATVDGSGNFAVNLTVPGAAAAGSYSVHVGQTVGAADLAHGTLTISAPPLPAVITLTPSSVTAGSNSAVTVHGTGFGPGESVAVRYTGNLIGGGAQIVQVRTSADNNGNFQTSLPVPASVAPGNYSITATGETSHSSATATLIVTSQPTITVNPTSVRPGQSITVAGTNFVSNQPVSVSAVVALTQGGSTTVAVTATPAANGSFSAILLIPGAASPGTLTINASQTQNGATSLATAMETVTALAPQIALAPTSVLAGQNTVVTGTGFGGGEPITVAYTANLTTGGTAVEQATATSDSTGSFSATLPVPASVAAGTYTVLGTGTNSHVSATASLTVTGQSTLSVSATDVRPGQHITVTGHNFSPLGTVSVSAVIPLVGGGSSTASATGTTDASGAFSVILVIPAGSAPGAVTLNATQSTGGTTVAATVAISILQTHPRITLSASTARPGQIVTIQGAGFSSYAQITVSAIFAVSTGGGRTVTSTTRTNNNGSFTAQVRVPLDAITDNTTIRVSGPSTSRTATLRVLAATQVVSTFPTSAIPGSVVSAQGHGYPPNASVSISVRITLTNGSQMTVRATGVTGPRGNFLASITIPTHAHSGNYQLTARSVSTGQMSTTTLGIAHLTPSIVASPASTTPGSQVTIQGFGWALGTHVTLSMGGQPIGHAASNGSGTFVVQVTIPTTLSSRTHTITAVSGAGRKAAVQITVSRHITTRFYFGSLYTGHIERLAMLNATSTRANVTITYQRTSGATLVKSFSIPPHTRYTRDVNADLGRNVSAAASMASDVPISASRINFQGTDGAVSPGSTGPSAIWYFANGNTSHGYTEYLALQNPNQGPVQVRVQLLPTHSKSFTVVRTMASTSRLTLKLNRFVKDAVGVIVRSNGPIVANRTDKIHQGIDSKNGVTAPQTRWYFAAGPRVATAHNWIGAINPSGRSTYVTVKAYDSFGAQVGTAGGWLKPYARVGYLMNKVAGRTNVAVVMTASRPIVAEQLTYSGTSHRAETDTFGIPQPGTARAFPALDTRSAGTNQSSLDLFNPGRTAIPILVQFMTSTGAIIHRTYMVNSLSHELVNVGSVVPNAQVGAEVTASGNFVAMSRTQFDNGMGASVSTGSRG